MDDSCNQWNELKKKLDASETASTFLPQEREVWMCYMGRNIGYEQNGDRNFMRPVLIIRKFDRKLFWIVPITEHQKPLDFYFNFTDPRGKSGAIILAQMKLMSVKRFVRVMYAFSADEFAHVQGVLVNLLQSKPRARRGFSTPPKNEGTL